MKMSIYQPCHDFMQGKIGCPYWFTAIYLIKKDQNMRREISNGRL